MQNVVRKVINGASIDDCFFEGIPEANPMISFAGTGYYHGKELPNAFFSMGSSTVFTHTLLLGSSGSGKTNVIFQIASQLNHLQNSICIIFDTKGDYKRHMHIRKEGDILLEDDASCPAWNIFDEIMIDGRDDKHVGKLSREISNALFSDQKNTENPFFYRAAADLFSAVLRCFVNNSIRNPAEWKPLLNNRALKHFLLLPDPQKYDRLFKNSGEFLPDLKGLASMYLGKDSNNQGLGIISEIGIMVNRYFQGIFEMEPDDQHHSFSIAEAIRTRKKGNIFIEYDIQKGASLSPMYSLLIDIAMKEALSPNRSDSRSSCVFFILDELKLLPRIEHLEDTLNYGRSSQVAVIAGLQSIHQLEDMYGKSKSAVILGGFGSIIALKMSDYDSRKYISETCGTNIIVERSLGSDYLPIEQRRNGFIVEDWDLQALSTGQAIIKLASQSTPFKFMFSKDTP